MLIGAAAGALMMPGIAMAQSSGSQPAKDAQTAADQHGLEEIVVTAQRREENLQRAALPVTAISGSALVSQSITQADDLTRTAPALQVTRGSANVQIYLRGVGTFGANAFAEQGVSFNLDGVYLSRPAAPAALFYDLDRLEVLKGPQGTLYGRNATGGALNLITTKPKLGETSGYINAEYGNYNALKGSAAINLPVSSKAAFRLAGQVVNRDGFFSDGYDDEKSQALRGQFLFDGGAGFNFNIMADYGHVGGKGSGGTIMPLLAGKRRLGPSDPAVIAAYLAQNPTAPVPQIIAKDDGYQDNNFYGVVATANADLGFATLTVIPAWRKTDLDFLSYASSFKIDVTEISEQTSIEARLANQSDALKWVVGGYYFSENVSARQFYDQASNGTRINSELNTRSYAVFGDATYSLTDHFRITSGIRYTSDNKKQVTEAHTYPFVGFVPPAFPNFIPIILDIVTNATADVDFRKATWKAGIEFDAGPHSLLYATVSTGFKSGILYSALGQNSSQPERMTAYTIGSKNRFLDNSLQLNLEAFYWDYKDQQISGLAPVQVAATPAGPIYGPVFKTENAGKATIYGLEADAIWRPTASDMLSVNVQYLHTKYDELRRQTYSPSGPAPITGCAVTPTSLLGATPNARIYNVDCSGQPLVNAPRWTVNAAYEHTFDLGGSGKLIASADTRLESSRYISLDYLALGRQGGYMMSNASLTWRSASGGFALTGFINNIEDKIVFANSFQSPVKQGVIYNQLRPPRTYGVRASVKF